MIVQSKEINRDIVENVDVCVIGSGAGGAVVGAELAEAGFKTVILEEGGYYTPKDFNQKLIDMYPLLYRDNGGSSALGVPAVIIQTGRCIGGTTTINSGTCFRTPEKILQDWEKNHGLEGINSKYLDPFFTRVEKIINVEPGAPDVIGKNAMILEKGMKALGLSGGPISRNAKGCKGCGVCILGCPEGAKQSMDISYIPRASQAGAKVYADCRADKLVVKNRRADGVEGVVLNRETRKPAYKFKINAKIVVVSGGAIMTPLLLLKNRLANGNGEVGKNLRLHPCSRVAGIFKEEVEAWKGVLQSFYIDSYRDEGIMFEATSLPLSGLALAMPYFGLKQKELMAQYRNLADVGYLISDTSSGRVRTGLGQEPFITYQINQTDHEKSVRAAAILSEILFAAGAEKVLSPIAGLSLIESPKDVKKIREMKIKKHYLDYMSFHPMGTCRMGKDPKKSVVNRELESHEVKGLFICDASILPTSTLVNPQMTIMAFATRFGFWLKENREKYQ